MKLNGLVGGGTGKLGNSVFSQNAGRTIVRQYQPEVRNPKTARQQDARARFAFFCGLSKKVATAIEIGFPRQGALTSRNRFGKLILPYTNGIYGGAISWDETGYECDWTQLYLAVGGMPQPEFASMAYDDATHKLTEVIASDYKPVEAGYVPAQVGVPGFVFVGVAADMDKCVVMQTTTTEAGTLEFDATPLENSGRVHFYGFAKWVPESLTRIPTGDAPWKFPSDQSKSVYLGSATM